VRSSRRTARSARRRRARSGPALRARLACGACGRFTFGAWRRLAPILTLLDVGAWRDDERRALVDLIRAKGDRSERDYVARYLAHPLLDAALLRCARAHAD